MTVYVLWNPESRTTMHYDSQRALGAFRYLRDYVGRSEGIEFREVSMEEFKKGLDNNLLVIFQFYTDVVDVIKEKIHPKGWRFVVFGRSSEMKKWAKENCGRFIDVDNTAPYTRLIEALKSFSNKPRR